MGIDAEMFVRVKSRLSEDDVRTLGYLLGKAFGHSKFNTIHPHESRYEGDRAHNALEIVSEWNQDGPTIHPEPREQFIRVHLATRYYGTGYERGDLLLILGVARWLEENIPNSSIWYGGDSSGVCAEPFGHAARESLWKHFRSNGHRPYNGYFDRNNNSPECPLCKEPATQYGSGGDFASFTCDGCGWKLVHKGGKEVTNIDPRTGWTDRERLKDVDPFYEFD